MTCAVIFHRFGPYHAARLKAASRLFSVVGIELSFESEDYPWEPLPDSGAFRRLTVVAEGRCRPLPATVVVSRVQAAMNDLHPDVVAVPGWSDRGALAGVGWCLRNGVPALIMSESTRFDGPRRRWQEWIKSRIIRLCSAALVGGAPQAEYLHTLGMAPDCVFRGYDAVDNGYFESGAAESRNGNSESARRLGLPEKFFLASARFIEKKNLPRLLESYAVYRKKAERGKHKTKGELAEIGHRTTPDRPWDLVLLGDGPLRESLERQIAALDLPPHVHLPGFKQYPDLPAYYGLASAFVHTSTTEQWGLVANEAMASGLPVVVSSRCGCVPDLVKDGVNGFTFDPYGVEGLAELMLKIWNMEEGERRRMGAAGQRIIADWGPDCFAAGLKAAAECALRVGPKRATIVDRIMLQALICR